MGKQKEQMCQGSCSVGFSLDHMNMKIGAPNVESIFTCRSYKALTRGCEPQK
jgi:3,4-dihydroxy 2-butanone 4-phosphate synthase